MAETDTVSANEADFVFKVGDYSADTLKVTGFTGSEAISRLFEFHVDLCSDESEIVPTELLGKSCTLEIVSTGGRRWVNGIVRRFERTGEGNRLTHYAVDIVPMYWLLTRRQKSRIFQEHNCPDMSVPGIIKKVFEDAGMPEDAHRFALEGTYDAHEYVVQYRESEMDFISRLMEEEGIFYFFEHSADGHKMVFGDSGVAHVSYADDAEVPFRDPSGLVPEKDYVYSLRDSAAIQFGATCLDDFNFTQPTMALEATDTADTFTALELSDWPGEYDAKSIGDRLAKIRLQEHQAARQVLQAATVARTLMTGFKFSLVDHPNAALNREYLITHISHRATQTQSGEEAGDGAQPGTQHDLDVRLIPSDVSYRPPRVTPRPTVLGSQTARVTGPVGEEIYTDKYGRVKVKFHWDREGEHDENASCWIRVSQGMAGGNYGMMFLPRVGQEVVVDFLEGNPDQPLITGRVYNGDHMPPYSLPDEKTKSVIKTHSSKGGGGNNEIRFEDLKGKEQLFLQAERQMDTRVKASHFHTVGGSYHLHVGGEHKGELKGELRELVYEAKHVHVKGDLLTWVEKTESRAIEGDQSIEVQGVRSLSVTKDAVDLFQANHSHEVTQIYGCKALGIKLEGSTGIELKCGGSSIVLTPAAIFISAPLVNINTGSGPPVTAPPAPGSSPAAAEDASVADSSRPGHDTSYSETPDDYEPIDPISPVSPPGGGPEEETTFVEFQLLDFEENPVPDEQYEVELPDESVRTGATDAEGVARFDGIEPGTARIRFPKREDAEWKKLRVEHPGQSGGDAGAGGGDGSSTDGGSPSGASGGTGGGSSSTSGGGGSASGGAGGSGGSGGGDGSGGTGGGGSGTNSGTGEGDGSTSGGGGSGDGRSGGSGGGTGSGGGGGGSTSPGSGF